uniref:Sulfhydryl oxidase n=1 Tax=Amphiprion percula TaxID=161767 RepID=A0A3P8UBF0_AMPPE
MFRLWFKVAAVLWLVPGTLGGAARLYTEEDPLVILSSGSLRTTVSNSSSAWLVQFFSSWCGHCIQYSGTWKALAGDVQEWQEAISVGVLDCAQEENFDVCKEFSIKFYPTFKYFRAHSLPTDRGTTYKGADREIQSVRQLMVNILQNHTRMDRPQHCPPLEPYSSAELLPLLGQRSDNFTAIIVEEPDSYVGREVILDLLQYSGVQVRRALSSDLPLLDALKISTFPSIYLLQPNGTHTHLHSDKKLRFFFSSLLKALPGVQRRSQAASNQNRNRNQNQNAAVTVCVYRAKVYLADLDSALHYLLRVEMATHTTLEGEELQVFKDFVTMVAKLYPGGAWVVKLMETLSDWLLSLPLQRIPYQAVLDLVDNKMRISGVYLGAELHWVGCQGSRAGLRGYPCSLWTLFHVLTVRHEATPTALDNTGRSFGCEVCGRHFEPTAAETLDSVQSREEQILCCGGHTTWSTTGWQVHNNTHNMVNNRLAGSLSDDPLFPKSPWPSTSLCSSCHEEKNGVHVWNHDNVLHFLGRPEGQEPRGGGRGREEELRHGNQAAREEQREVLVRSSSGSVWILGSLGFNSVDMSLCVLLYVSSCLVLMLLFFFFKVRSRRWKLRTARLHV